MNRIVLISCVSKKLDREACARDLYQSDLFRKSLRYAELLTPNAIYILSAKYGLLGLSEKVLPYDQTLKQMSASDVKRWAATVIDQLRRVADPAQDQFTFLAGDRYRRYLLPHIMHYVVPMQGLPIGKQLQFLEMANERKLCVDSSTLQRPDPLQFPV